MKNVTRREFIGYGAAASLAIGSDMLRTGAKKPNILLIMADQFRGDCLGVDGNGAIRTPNLDRLAREGFHFKNAYSSTPTCTPARSGLLTGLSPWHHGMLGYGRVGWRYRHEMPRALRQSGYRAIGIGKMHWYPQRIGHGFHKTILDESSRAETPDFVSDYRAWFTKNAPEGMAYDATGIGWNDYRSGQYIPPEELHPTFWTAQTAIEYIDKYDRREPLFMKVSFARPHSPYDPPKRFWDMYEDDAMPAPHVGDWAAGIEKADPKNYTLWRGDLGLPQAKRSRRGYYGAVTFIDEQIGRMLSALERKGILDTTLILFTADHGDMLGDHHHWRKSYAYEGSARIPFIARPPARMFAETGKTLNHVVELRDVFPTFLEAAGQAIPGNMDGRSIFDCIRGKAWREALDLEHDVCYSPQNHWNGLTDGMFKYVFHAQTGHEQLFNLKEDPGELRDLATDAGYRHIAKEWRERLAEHLTERGEAFVQDGKPMLRPKSQLYSPHYPGSFRAAESERA